jgi:hypothetical protein
LAQHDKRASSKPYEGGPLYTNKSGIIQERSLKYAGLFSIGQGTTADSVYGPQPVVEIVT